MQHTRETFSMLPVGLTTLAQILFKNKNQLKI